MRGPLRLPDEAAALKEEWAALTQDNKLAGHGRTPEAAIADAAAAGHGNVTLMWIPDEWPGVRGLPDGRRPA